MAGSAADIYIWRNHPQINTALDNHINEIFIAFHKTVQSNNVNRDSDYLIK